MTQEGKLIYILVFIFIVRALTISYSPIIWMDEVQIIDMGRAMLTNDYSKGINWDAFSGRLNVFPSLGAIIQELAFISTGGMVGPRLASLIFACGSAIIMYKWVKDISQSSSSGLISASFLITDPLYSESYRGGRIDSAAIFFALISFYIITRARGCGNAQNIWCLSSLGFFMLSVFTWPGAIVLFPLFCYCVINERKKLKVMLLSPSTTLWVAGSSILILLFFFFSLKDNGLIISLVETTKKVSSLRNGYDFIFGIKKNPALLFVSLFICFTPGLRWLGTAIFFGFIIVILSGPYEHRILYLTPYCCASIGLYMAMVKNRCHPEIHPTNKSNQTLIEGFKKYIVIIFIYQFFASNLGWTLKALSQKELRDPRILYEFSKNFIGVGSRVVAMGPLEFYYVGREFGWRMYNIEPSLESLEYALVSMPRPDDILMRSASIQVGTITLLNKSGYKCIDHFLSDSEDQLSGRSVVDIRNTYAFKITHCWSSEAGSPDFGSLPDPVERAVSSLKRNNSG